MSNKRITLPLAEILSDFGITRQSFYERNKKYKVFEKESFGYYSTTIRAFSQIKKFYQDKKSDKANLWKSSNSTR